MNLESGSDDLISSILHPSEVDKIEMQDEVLTHTNASKISFIPIYEK